MGNLQPLKTIGEPTLKRLGLLPKVDFDTKSTIYISNLCNSEGIISIYFKCLTRYVYVELKAPFKERKNRKIELMEASS
jgi:hypothetical protein